MIAFDEGDIRFEFDDTWQVIEKWDECRVYTAGIGKLTGTLTDAKGVQHEVGTKAMDFVGMRDGIPYLFEIKDFRGHRIENAKRQRSELPLEIGLKVRDTLAGLVGAGAYDRGPTWVKTWGAALKKGVCIVVWIAEDALGPNTQRRKREIHDLARTRSVKQKLAWLSPRVWVEDPLFPSLPGIRATNLSGAGQA